MMTCREKAEKAFKEELQYITEEGLRETVLDIFAGLTPAYFFTAPASSSGKYHPPVSNGRYGVIRHTKLACYVAKELFSAFGMNNDDDEDERNIIMAACLLHDIRKFGPNADENGKSAGNHTPTHGYETMMLIMQDYDVPFELTKAIGAHMGVWSCEGAKPYLFTEKPSRVVEIVHLADYIASRNFSRVYDEMLQVDYKELFGE